MNITVYYNTKMGYYGKNEKKTGENQQKTWAISRMEEYAHNLHKDSYGFIYTPAKKFSQTGLHEAQRFNCVFKTTLPNQACQKVILFGLPFIFFHRDIIANIP